MNAEIIAVGSELLLGQIANTNAQFISQKLAQLGINVFFHTVVGDNEARLEAAIRIAQSRADLIIFSGGLGPTKDDLTKETIAKQLHTSLAMDETALRSIEAYFAQVGREMTPNNKKQALVLAGSHVLPNDTGMAPGMAYEHEGKTYMLFPGPPRELKPMVERYALPYLSAKLGGDIIHSRVLKFYGIGESILETEISDLLEQQTNPTIAPLAGDFEVTLRLTAKAASVAEADALIDKTEALIRTRVGRFIYGYNATTLPEAALEALRASEATIASAESVTGGLFASELIALDNASKVVRGAFVTYTNEMKAAMLHINRTDIEREKAVSEWTAEQMAVQARRLTGATIGISFTGVAGADEVDGEASGTVYIGIATDSWTTVTKHRFAGGRNGIRQRAVKQGLFAIIEALK